MRLQVWLDRSRVRKSCVTVLACVLDSGLERSASLDRKVYCLRCLRQLCLKPFCDSWGVERLSLKRYPKPSRVYFAISEDGRSSTSGVDISDAHTRTMQINKANGMSTPKICGDKMHMMQGCVEVNGVNIMGKVS